MRRVFILALVSFTSIFIISGCNLFSFIEPGTEAEDYLNTGWEYYHDGDFSEAVSEFTKAIEKDPLLLDAYWGRAKSNFRMSGHSGLSILTQLTTISTDFDTIPLHDSLVWTDIRLTSLLNTLLIVNEDFQRINAIRTNHPETRQQDLDTLAYFLEASNLHAIYAIIQIRNSSQDQEITDEDADLVGIFDDSTFLLSGWDEISFMEQLTISIIAREHIDIALHGYESLYQTNNPVEEINLRSFMDLLIEIRAFFSS